jgi:hypothetical protein
VPPGFASDDIRDVQVVGVGDGLVALAVTDAGGEVFGGRVVRVADPGPPAEPLPTIIPSPRDPPDPLHWQKVATFDGRPQALAAGEGLVVAVGRLDADAATWSSTDGRTWTLGPPPEGRQRALMQSVAAWEGGFVAGGIAFDAQFSAATATFWWSDDGVSWHRAPALPEFELGTDSEGRQFGVSGLAHGSNGWVAVGSAQDGPRVFRSTDGRAWHLGADLGSESDVDDVVAAPSGYVAAGGRGGILDSGSAATWWSADGDAWGQPVMLDGAGLVAIAVRDGTFVAVGGGPAAWTSTGERSWAWAPDQTTLTHGTMTDVAIGGLGISAAGRDECRPGVECIVAWRSIDGMSWSRVELPMVGAADRIARLVEFEGHVVALGFGEQLGTDQGEGAIVWLGTAE